MKKNLLATLLFTCLASLLPHTAKASNLEISLKIHADHGEIVSSMTRRYFVQLSEVAFEFPMY